MDISERTQKNREYNKRWRETHKEYIREKTKEYRLTHSRKEENKKYYQKHKKYEHERKVRRYWKDVEETRRFWREYYHNHRNETSLRVKRNRAKNKILVLTYYGGGELKCKRCGETNINVLCIDHINGGGVKHRKSIGNGNIYGWLKGRQFPEGYQTLCANCNYIKKYENNEYKSINKYLPDDDERVKSERERFREFRRRQKREILTYYSDGKCACAKCGFDDIRALTIDHVNGGGAKHRKETERTTYRWLHRNKLPEGFQTLCFNCQFQKKVDKEER